MAYNNRENNPIDLPLIKPRQTSNAMLRDCNGRQRLESYAFAHASRSALIA